MTTTDTDPGETHAPAAAAGDWLTHVPIPLFAVVMGLGGLGLAWRRAHEVLGWPAAIGEAVLLLAAIAFVAILGLYAVKAARRPAAVRAEFNHPIRVNFFPAVSISALLMAGALLPYAPGAAEALFLAGAAGQLALALAIINRWITHNVEIHHSNPAWFIPVVGNIVVPVVGVRLGWPELSWFFFSVGLVFWLVLFTIVLYRIVFHDQLPQKFLPTLFILMAPPAIGLAAYLQLNDGTFDTLARVLFACGLFIALLLVTMAPLFLRLSFSVSWWAYTFPSASLAIACLAYADLVAAPGSTLLAIVVLLLATAIIAAVAVRTATALLAGKLFVPD